MVLKFTTQRYYKEAFTPTASAYTKGLWHGDDALDSSGNSNTFTLNGSATAGATGGKFGDCFSLTAGTSDYLSASSSADFDLNGKDYVIDFWFSQAADMGSGQYSYFWIGSDDSNRVGCHVDNKRLYCLVRSGGSTVVPISNSDSVGDWNPTAGWHHMALVHSGTDYHLYYDGTRRNTITDADEIPSGNRPFYLGYYPGVGYYRTGLFDEARVYVGDDYGWTGSTITVPTSHYKVV